MGELTRRETAFRRMETMADDASGCGWVLSAE